MLENIKKIDKKMLVMMGVIVGVILLFIVAILFVYFFRGKSISYEKIESKMISAAESYYKDNSTLLPTKIGDSVEVDAITLTSGGYMKDLSEYTKEGIICTGKVIVGKTPTEKYDYVPYLDCGEKHKTVFLYEKLKEDLVTSGDGLYEVSSVVRPGNTLGFDEDGYDLSSNPLMQGYIYRGEKVNNYVKFSEKVYRIIKIDGNNDYMFLDYNNIGSGVFDNRYNEDVNKNYGKNIYELSRAYETLSLKYQSLNDDGVIRTKGTMKNVCVGARSDDDSTSDGSTECSRVVKDQFFGLVPIYDYINASLEDGCLTATSPQCANYNYLSSRESYWTQTPSIEESYLEYHISRRSVKALTANVSSNYKPVYFMSNRLVYVSGTGTADDPYIVK